MKSPKKFKIEELIFPQPFEPICSSNNHVYFYDEIDRDNVLKLRKLIEEINQSFDMQFVGGKWWKKLFDRGAKNDVTQPCIFLHIHSYGGDVDASVNAFDFIESNRYPILTIAEGSCCSGATIMLMAGWARAMQKSTALLIHQIRGGMYGTHSEIKDQIHNWDLSNKTLMNIYLERSNLTEKQLKKMFKNEREIDAYTALELGLIDEIIGLEEEDQDDNN